MGGNEDRPTYDLADFAGGSKYWYVDPRAGGESKQNQAMEEERKKRQSLLDIIQRLGVVPQDEGMGF